MGAAEGRIDCRTEGGGEDIIRETRKEAVRVARDSG